MQTSKTHPELKKGKKSTSLIYSISSSRSCWWNSSHVLSSYSPLHFFEFA